MTHCVEYVFYFKKDIKIKHVIKYISYRLLLGSSNALERTV